MSERWQFAVAVGSTFFLIFFSWLHKEVSLIYGKSIYLDLTQDHPDDMLLKYKMSERLIEEQADQKGKVIVNVQENGVVFFLRLQDDLDDIQLLADEIILPYQRLQGHYWIGPRRVDVDQKKNSDRAYYSHLVLDYCGRLTWLGFTDQSLNPI